QDRTSATKSLDGALLTHGVTAILDDDGFLVILLHVRQRLGQDAGLIERADFGHEADLFVGGSGRVLSDCRPARKSSLYPLALREKVRSAAARGPKSRAPASSPSTACRR